MGPDPLGDPQRTIAAGSSPPDATTHYKLCPRCGSPAQLHATECANSQCRRPYRTQFASPATAPPPDPTVAYPAPPTYGYDPNPPVGAWDGSAYDSPPAGPPRAILAAVLVVLVFALVGVGIMIIHALRPPAAVTAPMPTVSGESQAAASTQSPVSEGPISLDGPEANAPTANAPMGVAETSPPPPAPAPSGPATPGAGSPVSSFPIPNANQPPAIGSNGPSTVPPDGNMPVAGNVAAGNTPAPNSRPATAPEPALPPSVLLPPGAAFVGTTRPTLPCGHPLSQTLIQPNDRIERAFCEAGDMFIRKGKRWVRP
jgi:hypothetical protein